MDDLDKLFYEGHPHEFIIEIQKEYGLEPDGLVGPKTSLVLLEWFKKRERENKIDDLLDDKA